MPLKVFPARMAFLLDSPLRKVITPLAQRLTEFGIEPGMKVVDVGAGTGFLLPALLDRVGKGGFVYAFDIQPALLDQGRAKVPSGAPVSFRIADAASTGLEDGSVDAVIFHHVFHEVADRAGTIQECRRILKPGGIVALWEPRLLVDSWRVRSFEGMFLGGRFELETRLSSPLGYGARFRAVDAPVGSRLREK